MKIFSIKYAYTLNCRNPTSYPPTCTAVCQPYSGDNICYTCFPNGTKSCCANYGGTFFEVCSVESYHKMHHSLLLCYRTKLHCRIHLSFYRVFCWHNCILPRHLLYSTSEKFFFIIYLCIVTITAV